MEGLLWKWTNYWSGWQPRWFILDDGILSYYTSRDEVASGSKGSIKMSVCDVVVNPGDSTRLDLTIPGEQHYFLKSTNAKERQQWLIALGSCKASLQTLNNPIAYKSNTEQLKLTSGIKQKRSELKIYCDLLMQQVHSLKETAISSPVDTKKLDENSQLLKETCDTFIQTLEDCMGEIDRTSSPNDRSISASQPSSPVNPGLKHLPRSSSSESVGDRPIRGILRPTRRSPSQSSTDSVHRSDTDPASEQRASPTSQNRLSEKMQPEINSNHIHRPSHTIKETRIDSVKPAVHRSTVQTPQHSSTTVNTLPIVKNPPDTVKNPPDTLKNPPDTVKNPPDTLKNPPDTVNNVPSSTVKTEPQSSNHEAILAANVDHSQYSTNTANHRHNSGDNSSVNSLDSPDEFHDVEDFTDSTEEATSISSVQKSQQKVPAQNKYISLPANLPAPPTTNKSTPTSVKTMPSSDAPVKPAMPKVMHFFNTLGSSFTSISTEDGVPSKDFLLSSKECSKIFDKMSATAFAPVKNDFLGNVKKIEQKWSMDPRNFTTLEKIVEYEVRNAQHTDPNSATQALLWLTRGLLFLCGILEEILRQPDMVTAVSLSYQKTLKPFHNFVVRGVVSIAMRAIPYKETFCRSLAENPNGIADFDEFMRAVSPDIWQYCHALKLISSQLSHVYQKHQMVIVQRPITF